MVQMLEERWQELSEAGRRFVEARELERAEEALRAALAVAEELGEVDPRVATTLSALARVRAQRNDHFGAAELLHRLLVLQQNTYGEDSPRVAGVMTSLAEMYAKLGAAQVELSLRERVLVIRRAAADADAAVIARLEERIETLRAALAADTERLRAAAAESAGVPAPRRSFVPRVTPVAVKAEPEAVTTARIIPADASVMEAAPADSALVDSEVVDAAPVDSAPVDSGQWLPSPTMSQATGDTATTTPATTLPTPLALDPPTSRQSPAPAPVGVKASRSLTPALFFEAVGQAVIEVGSLVTQLATRRRTKSAAYSRFISRRGPIYAACGAVVVIGMAWYGIAQAISRSNPNEEMARSFETRDSTEIPPELQAPAAGSVETGKKGSGWASIPTAPVIPRTNSAPAGAPAAGTGTDSAARPVMEDRLPGKAAAVPTAAVRSTVEKAAADALRALESTMNSEDTLLNPAARKNRPLRIP